MKIKKKYDQEGKIIDIILDIEGNTVSMLGSGGLEREKNIVARFLSLKKRTDTKAFLPVLVGSGLGYALKELLEKTDDPIAVIDKEDILNYTELDTICSNKRICWICSSDADDALHSLTQWQNQHCGRPMIALVHPFYMKLDKSWYKKIYRQIEASTKFDFWSKAIQPRFQKKETCVLFIMTRYFILGALKEACEHLNISYKILIIPDKEFGSTSFVEKFLHIVVRFHPDFVLTVNHFGVDKEGVLIDLLSKLQLPMASWFVDNPHLIIHEYKNVVSSWTTIFTWDEDNIPSLHALGYDHVYYLPLGTSQHCFKPRTKQDRPISSLFPTKVSFVGNSMVSKVQERMEKGEFSSILTEKYKEIAKKFAYTEEHFIQKFLQAVYPSVYAEYKKLSDIEQRLTYEAMITWEATLQYRRKCVEQLFDFAPVIVGDIGWKNILLQQKKTWYYQSTVGYYTTLPLVYIFSDINFNCTSRQMKGAVNQRVFDVPASGSFILTDWQRQIEALFEPKKEMIVYHDPEEIKDLISYYLSKTSERDAIVKASRRRVLEEHTWEHRLQTLLNRMREVYG